MFIELTAVWGRKHTININNISAFYPDPDQDNSGTVIEVIHATPYNEDFSDYICEYKESYDEVKKKINDAIKNKTKTIILSKTYNGKTPIIINTEHIVYIEPETDLSQDVRLTTGWAYHKGSLDDLMSKLEEK